MRTAGVTPVEEDPYNELRGAHWGLHNWWQSYTPPPRVKPKVSTKRGTLGHLGVLGDTLNLVGPGKELIKTKARQTDLRSKNKVS